MVPLLWIGVALGGCGGSSEGGGEPDAAVEEAVLTGWVLALGQEVRAMFYDPATVPDHEPALEAFEQTRFRLDHDLVGIELGSCASLAYPDANAGSMPLAIDVGDVAIVGGAGEIAELIQREGPELGTFYSGAVPLPAGAPLDLAISGSARFPSRTLSGLLRTPPALEVIDPAPGTDVPVVLGEDLIVTWEPRQSGRLVISVENYFDVGGEEGGYDVTYTFCLADPAAGTFAVPGVVFETVDASVTSLSIRLSEVEELQQGAERFVGRAENRFIYMITRL